LTLGFSANGPQPRVQNTYQVTDNFSKVVGHHTFKAGFNMDRLEINNPFYSNLNGNYSYQGAGVFSTTNPGADFLLEFRTATPRAAVPSFEREAGNTFPMAKINGRFDRT
jgi:hypothetical protein